MEGFIKSTDIQRFTGLSRAQVALLASKKKIPGAVRRDGYHFVFKDDSRLRTWMEAKRDQLATLKRCKVNLNPFSNKPGTLSIEGIHMDFNLWKVRVAEHGYSKDWKTEKLGKVWRYLKPIKTAIEELEAELRRRGVDFEAVDSRNGWFLQKKRKPGRPIPG